MHLHACLRSCDYSVACLPLLSNPSPHISSFHVSSPPLTPTHAITHLPQYAFVAPEGFVRAEVLPPASTLGSLPAMVTDANKPSTPVVERFILPGDQGIGCQVRFCPCTGSAIRWCVAQVHSMAEPRRGYFIVAWDIPPLDAGSDVAAMHSNADHLGGEGRVGDSADAVPADRPEAVGQCDRGATPLCAAGCGAHGCQGDRAGPRHPRHGNHPRQGASDTEPAFLAASLD